MKPAFNSRSITTPMKTMPGGFSEQYKQTAPQVAHVPVSEVPEAFFDDEDLFSEASSTVKPKKRKYEASGVFGQCEFSTEEVERIENLAKRPIPKSLTANRAGHSNTRLTYIEGWQAIKAMNDVFGLFGWSTELKKSEGISKEEDKGKVKITVQAVVRVTLKNGTYREGTGTGSGIAISESDAWEKALKEAETDAKKRAIKDFGDYFGNCLYDKNYVKSLAMQK